jgi:hypothetical protein
MNVKYGKKIQATLAIPPTWNNNYLENAAHSKNLNAKNQNKKHNI